MVNPNQKNNSKKIIIIIAAIGAFILISVGACLLIVPNSPSPANIDEFKARFENSACADKRNDLYAIDDELVFWAKEGSCMDASYSYTLYRLTPDDIICSSTDSIAGPRKSCNDTNLQDMFDTILENLAKPDLGLGDSTVEKTSILKNTNTNSINVKNNTN